MPHTIVIADDVTGANDIGIMYAKAGLSALVYSYKEGGKGEYLPCDALVIDTDSRFDTGQDAYRKVYDSLQSIPKEEGVQFIDKQCSVFRGNIGAEFDAMMDALGEDFGVVVLGFPDNGRTTLHHIHYVHGVRLEESQFKNDPVHPMLCSDLVEILQRQTKRKVGAIDYEVYSGGEKAVKEALEKAKESFQYVIMDVRDNGDLELLAKCLKNQRMICGSSALSEYLAKQEAESAGKGTCRKFTKVREKVFCMAGSLTPQTIAQTAYMKQKGCPVFPLDTRKLLDKNDREKELKRLYQEVQKAYKTGDFVMIHSLNRPKEVAETKELAVLAGIGNTEMSTLVSSALSEVTKRAVTEYQIRRIIVCGGDTSASLCAGLNIRGMRVLEEIEAGLPTCESVEEPYYRMVLKSGSFGSENFIEKAIEKLLLEGR